MSDKWLHALVIGLPSVLLLCWYVWVLFINVLTLEEVVSIVDGTVTEEQMAEWERTNRRGSLNDFLIARMIVAERNRGTTWEQK